MRLMFESALLLGRIRGIRIQVHYTWLVIFALLSLSLGVNFREAYPAWGEWVAYGAALAGVLLFFTSIVLHELGHSLVALARGIPVRSITLFIFGGVAELERESETARDEFMIAAAGPLVSFVLAALFLLVAPLLAPFSEPASVTAGWLGLINAAVAIFNLVPGFPLDPSSGGSPEMPGRGCRWLWPEDGLPPGPSLPWESGWLWGLETSLGGSGSWRWAGSFSMPPRPVDEAFRSELPWAMSLWESWFEAALQRSQPTNLWKVG
jgi:Zn-dependent protease